MSAGKRVGLYARVSTNDGRQDSDNQLIVLREYAKQRGFDIYKEYVDHMSGAKENRPALKALMQDAGKRKFDVCLVWRFDRFARSTSMLVNALEQFREQDISFISHQEAIDTSTPVGKMSFSIIAALAEFERSLIRERVVAGLARAKESGTVRLGRPRVGVDVHEALRMKREGRSWNQIAKALGVSNSTVRRTVAPLLKNPSLQTA